MKIKRTAERAKSAQVVASIVDLLTEILLRLPIKSLLRFKLVSKHWHSLITNRKFCRLRHLKPNPALGLLLPYVRAFQSSPEFKYLPFSVQNPSNPPFTKLKFTKDSSGICVLDSCNGLPLCSSYPALDPSLDYKLKYYVYNPTTKHFSTLPKPDQEGTKKNIFSMNLALDPAKSPNYRVVCVQHLEENQEEHEYQIEVYSSETGPWKVSSQPFTANVKFENGVYWNGSIHWIGYGTSRSLYFIIDEERLETLLMPPKPDGLEGDRNKCYLGESCDHLNLIETFGRQIQFNVYEMKRDYSEWSVKYQVDLSPVVTAFSRMDRSYLSPTNSYYYYAWSIFCLVRGEKDENSFLVLYIPGISKRDNRLDNIEAGKAIRYNLVYKTIEILHEFEGLEYTILDFTWTNGFQHIESLCCV